MPDKRSPFSQLSRYWLGESYYRSDQFDKALETFKDLYNNSALEGKTEGRLIPYDLAYCYFRLGDYDNAAKWFDEYLQGRNLTEGEDAAVRRADCDFVRKDYKTAVAEYEKALKRFPYKDNLYPNYRAGIAYGLYGGYEWQDRSAFQGIEHKSVSGILLWTLCSSSEGPTSPPAGSMTLSPLSRNSAPPPKTRPLSPAPSSSLE